MRESVTYIHFFLGSCCWLAGWRQWWEKTPFGIRDISQWVESVLGRIILVLSVYLHRNSRIEVALKDLTSLCAYGWYRAQHQSTNSTLNPASLSVCWQIVELTVIFQQRWWWWWCWWWFEIIDDSGFWTRLVSIISTKRQIGLFRCLHKSHTPTWRPFWLVILRN